MKKPELNYDLDFIRHQQVLLFIGLLASTEKLGNKKQADILEEYADYLIGEIEVISSMADIIRLKNKKGQIPKRSKGQRKAGGMRA